jgi:hypothetical protein
MAGPIKNDECRRVCSVLFHYVVFSRGSRRRAASLAQQLVHAAVAVACDWCEMRDGHGSPTSLWLIVGFFRVLVVFAYPLLGQLDRSCYGWDVSLKENKNTAILFRYWGRCIYSIYN